MEEAGWLEIAVGDLLLADFVVVADFAFDDIENKIAVGKMIVEAGRIEHSIAIEGPLLVVIDWIAEDIAIDTVVVVAEYLAVAENFVVAVSFVVVGIFAEDVGFAAGKYFVVEVFVGAMMVALVVVLADLYRFSSFFFHLAS